MADTRYTLGVDTGGTFTDFLCLERGQIRIHKVLSTPDAPERAIIQGIVDLGLTEAVHAGEVTLVHGSTVATNAALEGKGVRTAFVTNRGFADMLTLGRQNRSDIYALQPQEVAPPVPAELCFEVDCRRAASGEPVIALDETEIERLAGLLATAAPEAVAINLLYSYKAPQDEQRLAAQLPKSLFVSCSHEVLAEYREYERGIATWLNAWLGPRVAAYLNRLAKAVKPCPLAVMQSHGGTIRARDAARRAVNLLLSGPAGGLAAALEIGKAIGSERLLTFDMGGTSTDVALLDGAIRLTNEGHLGSYPVAVAMVDMHTIGAGGGSLAFLDEGGLLRVGPKSAGAQPGPACYGQGGCNPTVTDANALLGRLQPEHFLGGRMALDVDAAAAAIAPLARALGTSDLEAAQGIVAVANEHMAAALRVISVQRGRDPKGFALCCFGGAGGLHVCALADALHMDRILVPANGGVLSAYGMLVAPRTRQLSQSILADVVALDSAQINRVAARLKSRGHRQLVAEGDAEDVQHRVSLDCRYAGQSFHINLPWSGDLTDMIQAFHSAHTHQYGHALNAGIEIVNVRVESALPARRAPLPRLAKTEPGTVIKRAFLAGMGQADVWSRSTLGVNQLLNGPAIICEDVATTLVEPGWWAQVDVYGHLHLRRGAP